MSIVTNNNCILTLKKGEGRSLKAGGAWIYDNEVDRVDGAYENGDIIAVADFDDYPMGYGVINDISKIRVRMLSRYRREAIDDDFIYSRVKAAWEYRKAVLKPEDLRACRLIFGEADWLPGLVVDRYEDMLVAESLSLGIDRLKQQILDDLIRIFNEEQIRIRAIFERSDAPVRKKEGMAPFKGLIYKDDVWLGDESIHITSPFSAAAVAAVRQDFDPHVEIVENGVHYLVDVQDGQKTGFFLDQKYNRLAMQQVVRGCLGNESNLSGAGTLKVLDCFTHMGTFALNCGLAGATDVTGLDISEFAVQQATENATRNGLGERVRFRAANVLDELPRLNASGEKYDIVILDPPAFTKSREATKNAIKGYRQINIQGLKLVRSGGFFATCSCSHFMTQELFTKTIAEAAASAHKRLRQVEFRTQAPDHPILWAADESYYLKFLIFQVCDDK